MTDLNERGITYVLPIRAAVPSVSLEFRDYLGWVAARAEVIVVDGSSADVFAAHEAAWGDLVVHVAPHNDLATDMGKVGGVLTGIRIASNEHIVIADDDVRYDGESLHAVVESLGQAAVARPQNFFDPLPWHAKWDTSRALLNRVFGGDWPGTLGVRGSVLHATGGYDGSVMFENLELVRTVQSAGGTEALLPGVYVRRLPSTAAHFWSQRIRQAYDEFARPARLVLQLVLLPAILFGMVMNQWIILGIAIVFSVLLAEIGRRKAGGARIFPATTPFFAPLWLAERAVCSWLALGTRVFIGGVRYNGTVLRRAATPTSILIERHGRVLERHTQLMPDQTARRRSA
ncbi:MAG: glycosyltransferase [Gemmatimonadales bacterium]